MSLRNALKVSLMRIPKGVRKMSVKEFEGIYGGDVIGAIRKGIDEEVEEVMRRAKKDTKGTRKRDLPPPSTPGQASKRQTRVTRSTVKATRPTSSVLSTPSGKSASTTTTSGSDFTVPSTPSTVRAARRGEIAYSTNGSPVGQSDVILATVKKSRTNNEASSSLIGIEMDDGKGNFVDIGRKDVVEGMDDDMKRVAVTKLKSLQDEVAALMAQLGN